MSPPSSASGGSITRFFTAEIAGNRWATDFHGLNGSRAICEHPCESVALFLLGDLCGLGGEILLLCPPGTWLVTAEPSQSM